MTVKQALKKKNLLLAEIRKEFAKVTEFNSVLEANVRHKPYSSKEALENWLRLNNELIDLKRRIHLSNVTRYKDIFRLSELKAMVAKLAALDCDIVGSRSRYESRYESRYVTEISQLERDELIRKLEAEIDKLHEELDVWNYQTLLVE